ncbi:MAG: DUF3124 domain-containing protein [Flavobacteriaceae bacterium]
MKKHIGIIFTIAILLFSCDEKKEVSSINPVNWNKRQLSPPDTDSLTSGMTYLSIYSQIYSQSEHRTHNLTATVSMRNTNLKDTIFIEKADYFDTHGELIRTYFNKTIYIAPMETVEIVIDETDKHGGTGANFVFDWKIPPHTHEPFFEGVMISTSGQQGISFTTQGRNLH